MKTELVSAIHLQEVELQENAPDRKSRCFQSLPGGAWRWSFTCSTCLSPALMEACFSAADETFTVEEAVETIGFGRFHVMLFFIMGGASVRRAPPPSSSSSSFSSFS